jgi:hypothetical protein
MTLRTDNAHDLDRRRVLQGALAGAAGAVLAGPDSLLHRAARAADPTKKAKACIVLWMSGGPSQFETFDLKPDAPAENRGEFKPIDTKAKGVQICEHLPKLAKQADKLAIIRSMNTVSPDHTGGAIHMLTGFPADPLGLKYPWIGSVVAKYKGDPKSDLPGCVSLAGAGPGQPGEGFLGPAYQPLRLASHEAAPPGKIAKACDITTEWEKYGKVYGDTPLGKHCLAARRLIEAGVPFVQVTHGGYDGHSAIFNLYKARLEHLDPAWSGLMQDLSDRGLLDSTLIVWMGEFGRTPRINANSGRDHWTRGWSTVLAGGGIKGGVAYGATAKDGVGVAEKPVTEGDLLATVYTALGIDPKATNMVGTKAIPLTPEGSEVIKDLVG